MKQQADLWLNDLAAQRGQKGPWQPVAREEFVTPNSAKAHAEAETPLTFGTMLCALPRSWAVRARVSHPALPCPAPAALVGAGVGGSTELTVFLHLFF